MATLYKELTKKDKKYIKAIYETSKTDIQASMDDVQTFLADKYGVHKRTIRTWAKKLDIVDNKFCLDFTKLKETKKGKNVLVIGDLHTPFCLDGYLEFCKKQYIKYNCNEVIFIGDVIDNHYSSYHETDADGAGGGDELDAAIRQLSRWNKTFPEATVLIGNHDRMVMRKAQTSAIPKAWIKEYKDVLNVPKWNFVDRYELDGVQYIHGEAGTASTKCRADMMNTVQGHLHTQCYTQWFVGHNFKIFGSQVGCGIDADSYAMGYAKRGKKPAIGCMVVLEGETPINILMNL